MLACLQMFAIAEVERYVGNVAILTLVNRVVHRRSVSAPISTIALLRIHTYFTHRLYGISQEDDCASGKLELIHDREADYRRLWDAVPRRWSSQFAASSNWQPARARQTVGCGPSDIAHCFDRSASSKLKVMPPDCCDATTTSKRSTRYSTRKLVTRRYFVASQLPLERPSFE